MTGITVHYNTDEIRELAASKGAEKLIADLTASLEMSIKNLPKLVDEILTT